MSEPNGSTNLADGDECGIANPPSNSSQSASLQQAPWADIYPGLAIAITVLAFTLIGDGLRDHFDPRGVSR